MNQVRVQNEADGGYVRARVIDVRTGTQLWMSAWCHDSYDLELVVAGELLRRGWRDVDGGPSTDIGL